MTPPAQHDHSFSRPHPDVRLRVLSLGAGVQSTTVALLAARGLIGPMPDIALFADTGAEPGPVYDHLRWLQSDNVLPFPIEVLETGDLRAEITGKAEGGGKSWARPPFYIANDAGKVGTLNRQCTRHKKADPIRRRVKALAGYAPRSRPRNVVVEQWIGISLDEIFRVKPSRDAWIANRWPLLELHWTRRDCLAWLEAEGFPRPPKSACTFCPYRDDAGWRDMRDNDPDSRRDAVEVDRAIRHDMPGVAKSAPFVHRSMVPLDQVDLSTTAERGQPDLFLNECEGMCGN